MTTPLKATWNPLQTDQAKGPGFTIPAPSDTPLVLVDDERAVLEALARLLRREGYPIRTFDLAEEAIESLSSDAAALLITDIRMPKISGIDLARRAMEEDPDLSVIILTGAGDTDTAVESLRLGVQDYLTKPVDSDALLDAVRRSLRQRAHRIYRREMERWVREEVRRGTEEAQEELDRMRPAVVTILAMVVRVMESRDRHMQGHSDRVAAIATEVGRRLKLDAADLEELRTAGLLHDIGMIAVPDSVTQKDGKLSESEWDQVRRHPVIGAELLKPLRRLARVSEYVRYHHERLNGSGYPEGVSGNHIPVGAQILGLAEALVSITEERAYRPACSPIEALEILRGSEGVWYQRHLLDALEQVVKESVAARGR